MPPSPLLLVVDDEDALRLIVEKLGRRAGLEVVGCPDAASAWEWLQRHRPDLVLLDRNLPGDSGLTLCRRIRAEPGQAGLRVALFGHPDLTEEVAEALEAGVDAVVAKDLVLRPREWQDCVTEILARPPGQPGVGP